MVKKHSRIPQKFTDFFFVFGNATTRKIRERRVTNRPAERKTSKEDVARRLLLRAWGYAAGLDDLTFFSG